MTQKTKFRIGNYRIPVELEYDGDRIFVHFGYNKTLIEEIKAFEGHHYHGYDEQNPRKVWSIANSQRNQFQLDFLQEKNPYKPFDDPLIQVSSTRPMYTHQLEMKASGLTRHYNVWACEMGTGKSLAAIEVMEDSGIPSHLIWYVGPKSGVMAVRRELSKWQSKVSPIMMTYEEMVKRVKANSFEIPQMVIFDESSKIKTPTAQRSQVAKYVADAVRERYGKDGYVILMTGTPAPKTPLDWWHQCEVACPGFIREGSLGKFKMRLSLVEERQSSSGGVYPHIITWLDDETKCAKCGQTADHENHKREVADLFDTTKKHDFEQSRNEVHFLYRRLAGLVVVKFKKDCLDLPEKQYKIIRVTPTVETLRAAKLIKESAARVIEALTRLRELSDGFQYSQEVIGQIDCPNCSGKGECPQLVPNETPDPGGTNTYTEQVMPCAYCGGTGKVPKYARRIEYVTTPKDEMFVDLLDEHDDIGRFIVWGGFEATIDKLVHLAKQNGWSVLRVDGRGYRAEDARGNQLDVNLMLDAMDASHPKFQELRETHPKVCFVGHPRAGGMALTLTGSPTELFYSNDFDGTARMQAEDRFHRAGMDTNRGATIIDLIHLPTDQLVLDNLKKKKLLQSISMGELNDAISQVPSAEGPTIL